MDSMVSGATMWLGEWVGEMTARSSVSQPAKLSEDELWPGSGCPAHKCYPPLAMSSPLAGHNEIGTKEKPNEMEGHSEVFIEPTITKPITKTKNLMPQVGAYQHPETTLVNKGRVSFDPEHRAIRGSHLPPSSPCKPTTQTQENIAINADTYSWWAPKSLVKLIRDRGRTLPQTRARGNSQ